jgi:catechol 2,3-dioxygenase-like lactoylglutathione lyase family enzyme
MLSSVAPVPVIATADLSRARAFYEEVLGFTPSDHEMPGGVTYRSGGGEFSIYVSEFAGTNKATAMSFRLSRADFDSTTAALRAAGVAFDTFDAPGVTWQDGVAHMGDYRAVWFRDPDGNVLGVTQPPE